MHLRLKILEKRFVYFYGIDRGTNRMSASCTGVDASVISEWFNENNSLDFFNQLTGGSFSQMSIFALNITPYITASIILQLLTIAIPRLEELHKDGEEGRKNW